MDRPGAVDRLVFEVGGRRLAAALDDVREVVALGAITPVPTAPAEIRGLVAHRGEVLPVIDLARRTGPPAAGAALLVVRAGGEQAALETDAVLGIVRVGADELAANGCAALDVAELLERLRAAAQAGALRVAR